MAVTIKAFRNVTGNTVRIYGTITGPASYTTNGETLSAAQIRLLTDGLSSTVLTSVLVFSAQDDGATAQYPVLDVANKKMKFFAGSTEVTNTTNLSTLVCNFEILARASNTGAGITV